jgi:iron complex outermembrane receptor protein
MAPNTFISINDGRRLRLGTYAELASQWSPQWSTLLGLRNDTVWTNAGDVQGYSDMYAADATAFNATHRARTDVDIDLTALARYMPNATASFEFGYARKSRAPSLYERYAWSTNWMVSGMIGWFGDGNYYVGNTSLKPETANTVSGTAAFHGHGPREWEVKATPYVTYAQDYVDVNTLATTMYGMSTFAQLQFANHNARIAGGDISGMATLWGSEGAERGVLSGVGGWVHGSRTDTNSGLYQIMPINLRLSLDEEWKGLVAGMGMEAVDRKSHLDPNRLEQATPGYTLFNLHASYRRGFLEANAGADNLFNRWYELPLGGLNFDDYMASMWMNQILPLTGRGRSAHFSLTARF